MKKIFLLLCIVLFKTATGQCDYNSVLKNNSTKSLFLKLNPITIDIYETPFNGRLILATLIRNGDLYYIDFEITRDSSARELDPHCYEKGDSIELSLADNSTIVLNHVEDRICGVRLEQRDYFISVTDYMRVILQPEDIDKLSDSEVILMAIKGSDFKKNIVLKSELEEYYDDGVYLSNPTRFFMDNIECLTNPDLE